MGRIPRISVLLPVFNAASYLRQCLASLARQSWTDFEVIAVDDGSTDESRAILAQAAAADDRIRIFSQQHQGLVSALNKGLDRCRGALVARIDADDLALSRRLELQAELMGSPGGPGVASSLVAHFPVTSLREGFRIYEEWLNSLVSHEDIIRERFIESPIPHPSAMVSRTALLEVGGYRDLGWPEDYDLWLRLAAAGVRFGKVPQVLCLWRLHEQRLTHTDPRYSVERFLACKASHLVEGPLADCRRVVVWGSGQTGRRLSKHLARFGAPLTAFVDIDPNKIGGTMRALPIHSPDDLPGLLEPAGASVVLAAVSSRGARAIIRQRLMDLGMKETRDFWCVA